MKRLLPRTVTALLLSTLSPSVAETIVIPGSDESVPSPEIVAVGPYLGPTDSDVEPGSFFTIEFLPVPDAVAYRIYLELDVYGRRDSTGTLVPTDTSELQFVPWGSADAIPDADVLHVVFASLEGTATRYGAATEVIRDGEVHFSPLRVGPGGFPPGPPTDPAVQDYRSGFLKQHSSNQPTGG